MSNPGGWIGPSADPRQDVGVFVFRRRLNLESVRKSVQVRVSADARYRLYVGTTLIGLGPARGDLDHWAAETYDLAPYLRPGPNLIWALVWNFGHAAPMAQMGMQTGFLLLCDALRNLGTHETWEVAPVPGWNFGRMTASPVPFYLEVGPGEEVDGGRVPAPELLGSAELDWHPARFILPYRPKGDTFESGWSIEPSPLPPMRYEPRREAPVARHGHQDDPNPSAPDGDPAPTGPLNDLLLDYRELLCAYPRLELSGTPGSVVTITYEEGLWEPEPQVGVYGPQPTKGHRDVVQGKNLLGIQDRVILGEGPVTFEPLWWRTYRYLHLSGEGFRLHRAEALETGYPYDVGASFQADAPETQPIWDVAVRTARRCAGETYFDCPYYEQLQYVGDTRIQALIHYYLSDDRRLPRRAVEQFAWSIGPDGLTKSRYPSHHDQRIPPFSLWWITMLWDAVLYDGTLPPDVSRSLVRRVLEGYRRLLRSPEGARYWAFCDWVPGWSAGQPPGGMESAVLQRQLQLAELAADRVCRFLGEDAPSPDLPVPATPDDTEHAEALRRLLLRELGRETGDPWPTAHLAAHEAPPTTLYFSYYRHLAQRGHDYFAQLGPWREMIEDGLTTFAETQEPTRSDCPAWSAHPILGFFQIVAGIESAAPRWEVARIEPNPGSLRRFQACVPHPRGPLEVTYEAGRYLIDTPVPAQFRLGERTRALPAGRHEIQT